MKDGIPGLIGETMKRTADGVVDMVVCDAQSMAYWFGVQDVTRVIGSDAYASEIGNMAVPPKLPIEDLERLGIRSRPVHVLVEEHRQQRFSSQVITHLWKPPYPERTFVRAAANIYVLSPIASLMRAAPAMSDIAILKALYQLVGSYRYGKDGLHERPALMTVAAVNAYLEAAQGIRGAKKVQTLLKYVVDGAASPEEAKVAIVLVLPERMGGYGLPLPTLNESITVLKNGEPETRRPDIFWKAYKLIVEYLGEEFHNRPDRFGPDAARKAHFQEAGYKVIDLTHYQITRKDELESVVATIRRHMGMKPLKQGEDYMQKNAELRKALFGKEAT